MDYALIKPSWLKEFANILRYKLKKSSVSFSFTQMITELSNINFQKLPYTQFLRIYEEDSNSVNDGIVRIPEGIETVAGDYLFYNAKHMQKLVLPKTLKKFCGDDGTMFAGCDNLTEIIFLGDFSANIKINFTEIDKYCSSKPYVYVRPEVYDEYVYQGASNGFNAERVLPLNRVNYN